MNSSEPIPSEYLPRNFDGYTPERQKQVIAYISQLNAVDKRAYLIAKTHLGTSFNVVKSNDFNAWLKSATTTQ